MLSAQRRMLASSTPKRFTLINGKLCFINLASQAQFVINFSLHKERFTMGKDLENRALAAYFRSAAKLGGSPNQPSPPTIATVDGKQYVVLSNTKGILAVYRVRTDGVLKGLVRWPAELSAMF